MTRVSPSVGQRMLFSGLLLFADGVSAPLHKGQTLSRGGKVPSYAEMSLSRKELPMNTPYVPPKVWTWDKENGGMLYYTDVYNKPVQEYWHNMKFWWPHDEAFIAMTLAYKLTGEERYAIRHDMVRNWAFSHFQDVQHGDWFGYLNKDGSRANTLKGSLWKSFFHHPRAMWCCAHYCGAI